MNHIEKPDYLSPMEVEEIQKFLENTRMREAVKKVILSGVYIDGRLEEGKPADPLKNFMLGTLGQQHNLMNDDRHLGAMTRSIINAISMVESGFGALETLRKVESAEEKPNTKGK